ncbi:acetylglutamate semialdehyde dehydrogenase [Paenibacillus sp. JNUCC32]|uniref:acetylglutamate semialdehyde dehydrogenase n=1 Tax=Paenibacillus sp. JNUCC32 TaxID=2777984 RepID=UPI0017881C1F|nr:acetylglutamate semialdehyde dehydrogenase [Paenibacillus sp. JNUCC-32]QOT12971.1 acetylglutamate semialdehyde dehydrogenase [Paenibacillus sp. JNUCC-32]
MGDVGLSIKEYFLSQYADEKTRFREITRLDEKDEHEYKVLLEKLIKLHEGSGKATTGEKGKALEHLVTFLLEKSSIFNVYENIRNTTNEIDQLLELNHIGRDLKKFITLPGEMFLSECKNYNKKIGVTWVGKFFTLLASNQSKIGLLFSYYGLAGSNWSSASGLTRKLFLLREKLEDRTHIIDINIKDFKAIEQGKSLLEIIDAKMKALRIQTNFDKFLKEKHPALLENSDDDVD